MTLGATNPLWLETTARNYQTTLCKSVVTHRCSLLVHRFISISHLITWNNKHDWHFAFDTYVPFDYNAYIYFFGKITIEWLVIEYFYIVVLSTTSTIEVSGRFLRDRQNDVTSTTSRIDHVLDFHRGFKTLFFFKITSYHNIINNISYRLWLILRLGLRWLALPRFYVHRGPHLMTVTKWWIDVGVFLLCPRYCQIFLLQCISLHHFMTWPHWIILIWLFYQNCVKIMKWLHNYIWQVLQHDHIYSGSKSKYILSKVVFTLIKCKTVCDPDSNMILPIKDT